jgi:selenium metabolism protein YedF
MAETMQSELAGPACCAEDPPAHREQIRAGKKILVLLATDRLGKGDDELGRKIVINFIRTMKEMGDDLWRLVLLNAGVKLAVEGSESLHQLQELAREGLDILVCGPCLKTFQLLEKKQVGELTSMLDIVTSMQLADKVISLS